MHSFFFLFVILAGLLVLSSTILQNTNAETTIQNCLGCVNNTNNQILTIFNFQDYGNPFLGGNATFIVTPNPFAHTTNATDYLDLTTWFNFVVSDGSQFDSDPTPGIIEIVGVNNGTYSIMQIKGSSGFGMALYPEASDEILGTTGFSYVTQTSVNFTTTDSATIEPPHISDATLDKLKNTGGAKINGITISNANDLPPAKVVTTAQKLTATPPAHVVFTKTFSSTATPSTLISTLGIPTYSPPTDTSGTGTAFIPPVFVAPVASGGGNFIVTPVMDTVVLGSNIVIRADQVDQGTDKPILKAINLPMNTQGTNVGVSVRVDDKIPSGAPSIPSGFVGLYLNLETTGDIDFSSPSTYTENPTITFALHKVGSTCPTGVTLYLQNGASWNTVTSNLSPTSTDAHTCTYSPSVQHFSSYLVGTGSATVTHGHGTSTSHISSHTDSSSHDSHSNHAHTSLVDSEHLPGKYPHEHAILEITKQLTIYEIQYSLQTGTAQVIIGTTGTLDEIEVQAHGRQTGFQTAKPTKVNPFALLNKNIGNMNKYVFEFPIAPDETYFRISIDDSKYTLAQTVTITSSQGKVIPWYAEASESVDHLDHSSGPTTMEYSTKFDGGTKTVLYNDVEFPIKYEMMGAISGLQVDEESKSVTFLLSGVAGGQATMQIPRNLVDAAGDNFVVLVTASPQEQIDYQITSSTSSHYTLQMELPEGTESLTIIGTAVVPEFGFLAPLIFGMAIIPIVMSRKKFN